MCVLGILNTYLISDKQVLNEVLLHNNRINKVLIFVLFSNGMNIEKVGVPGFQVSGVPGFQVSGVPGFQVSGVPGFQAS